MTNDLPKRVAQALNSLFGTCITRRLVVQVLEALKKAGVEVRYGKS